MTAYETYMAEKAANFERWYWIDRRLLREFQVCKPSILVDLEARLAERWHVVSHRSRSATWIVGALPAEVTLACNSQSDGNKFCTLKTAKSGQGRALFDLLCGRLLDRGATLMHDSELPVREKEATESEVRDFAMRMLICSVDRMLNCKRSEFKLLDSRTFEAARNTSSGNMRWIGWSQDSHRRVVELAATITYEQFFAYLYDSATYEKGNQRLCYSTSTSADGVDGICKRLDPTTRTGTIHRYRIRFDHILRGLFRWLAKLAMQRHCSLAWNLNMMLFSHPDCSVGAWLQHLSFVLRGWRLTPHTKLARRELRKKLSDMKREWSR